MYLVKEKWTALGFVSIPVFEEIGYFCPCPNAPENLIKIFHLRDDEEDVSVKLIYNTVEQNLFFFKIKI